MLYQRNIKHTFFDRVGGLSSGIYDSLNCGYGSEDSYDNVSGNRKRVIENFGAAELCTLYQIHSNTVVTVESSWEYENSPEADGMVTNVSGLILGILTADCAPVLFEDKNAGVIGAAHAGWRGAKSGVLQNTIVAMHTLGANISEITAYIGPCIGKNSYEVDMEFYKNFIDECKDNKSFFVMSGKYDHFLFDLSGYVKRKLENSGISKIIASDCDTFLDEGRFFSYRRATIKAEKGYGRQISAISIIL